MWLKKTNKNKDDRNSKKQHYWKCIIFVAQIIYKIWHRKLTLTNISKSVVHNKLSIHVHILYTYVYKGIIYRYFMFQVIFMYSILIKYVEHVKLYFMSKCFCNDFRIRETDIRFFFRPNAVRILSDTAYKANIKWFIMNTNDFAFIFQYFGFCTKKIKRTKTTLLFDELYQNSDL